MSRNQRLALVAAVVVVAAIAFAIARAGSDDDGTGDNTRAIETAPRRGASTTTTPERPTPTIERIAIQGGQVEGGVKTIRVTKGERVRIVVSADAPDQLHLHGYDIEREAQPGSPARFAFEANLEGVFDLESHTAEDAGIEPAVAKLVVEPS